MYTIRCKFDSLFKRHIYKSPIIYHNNNVLYNNRSV